MLKAVPVPIEQIYVPTKRRNELDAAKAKALADDILDKGLSTPIQVRRDKDRYVLVTGLHRLEALKILGETTVPSFVVQSPKR